MSDPEKKPLKGKTNEDDNGQDIEKQEESCCDKFALCIVATGKIFYMVVQSVCSSFRNCCSYFLYPIKEWCCKCADCCDKTVNPWKDPSYAVEN